jgi:two-component system nitrogen regulation sensor histidine kinase GlnL
MATVRQERSKAIFNVENVVGALPYPVLVLNVDDVVDYMNGAAEHFFEQGKNIMVGRSIGQVLSSDSPVYSLLRQVRSENSSVSEYDVDLNLQRGGGRGLSVHVAPFGDAAGGVVLSIHAQAAARNMERQLSHRSAARSVSAMAAMLAHEVKNPLSGIRGAAQLLERVVEGTDRELAQMICGEADRINALVDRMGGFVADAPLERSRINIHEVLERVQQSAEAGFAHHVNIVNDYDPSLPPAVGNRDQLIQVFLNLIKNASEAVSQESGEIVLKTGFRRSVRLAPTGGDGSVHLPLMVSVSDNGPGMSADIARHLFDPFITTKSGGTGLGLALVAKLVDDHGGIIEFETAPSGTEFRVFLPISTETAMRAGGG